jgi:SAM-dependent methyltransferase
MCEACLSWYGRHLAPYFVHAGCSANTFTSMRRRMLPKAKGVIVEVGCGSGLNLGWYDAAKVERLVGIDPDPAMLAMAEARSRTLPFGVRHIQAFGEDLPLGDGSADTVVLTYALCTIPNPREALLEIRRILKPAGQLVFVEHGLSEEPRCRRWQQRLNRPWQWLAGGCHLDRLPLLLIQQAGFRLIEEERSRFALPFWQLGMHCAGIAAPTSV